MEQAPVAEGGIASGSERPRDTLGGAIEGAKRWSFVLIFLLVIAVFGAIDPDTFLTWDNARSILDQSAPLAVVALGVTVVLLIGDFDLSVGFTAQAAAAAAVVSMADLGASLPVAILLGLATGAGVGLVNGVSVAYFGIPSFIATLAVGTLAAGLELAIAESSVFEGLAPGYDDIARSDLFGEIPLPVVIVGVIMAVLAFGLRKSVAGRHATAIGDNPAAAALAGVPVRRLRLLALVVAGLFAAVAGILLSAKANSYYANLGTGLLLPAYAAAFLGLSLGGGWRFNVMGTVLGVLFLGTIATGLVMLDQPAWVASVIQGSLLLAAVVVLSRRSGGLFR